MLIKSPKGDEIICPILRGRDIQKYKVDWQELFLIGTFPSYKINIEDYPDIKKHLLSFGIERLKQTGEVHLVGNKVVNSRKKTHNKWFETQDQISYWKEFYKPKIIYPNMTKYLPFVYDKGSYFVNQKCFIITGDYLSYLTAFFNSRLFKYCYREKFPELQGGTRELSKIFFEKLIVKPIDRNTEDIFSKLVSEIQELHGTGQESQMIDIIIEKELAKIYDISDQEYEIYSSYKIT